MPFIGIISEENVENCIRREILDKLQLRESNVLFIKEKSIENIKNIKFETILILRQFNKQEMLKKLLENSTYLIINSDIVENLNLLENIKATVFSCDLILLTINNSTCNKYIVIINNSTLTTGCSLYI